MQAIFNSTYQEGRESGEERMVREVEREKQTETLPAATGWTGASKPEYHTQYHHLMN